MLSIILVSGKAESGKDSFYEIARSESTNHLVERVSFADEVKRIARMIGWDGNKDQRGITFLQNLSYSARVYDEEIWIRKVDSYIAGKYLRDSYKDNQLVIITDCRYANQISYFRVKYSNVFTVRINRPEHKSKLTEKHLMHASETDLDVFADWNYVIANDRDFDKFKLRVVKVVKDIIGHIDKTHR